jgi:hypothetical protein
MVGMVVILDAYGSRVAACFSSSVAYVRCFVNLFAMTLVFASAPVARTTAR